MDDSDLATAAAETNGGSAYRSRNPDVIMVGNISKNMLEYYGRPSPAVWRFGYASDTESTMFIFIDAVSGAHLSTLTDVATDARYNLEAADFCAEGFSADAKLTFVMNNTSSLDEQGKSSDSWLFSYYSTVKDSFISYQIIAGQVVFVCPFGGGLGSKYPLPENWINSSQAMSVAEANGGSDYRSEGITVQVFLTKEFPTGGDYDVPAQTAVWFIQYLGTDFSVMVNDIQKASYHQILWDGKDNKGKAVASGVFVYQIKANDFVAAKKMLLLR